MKFTLKKREKVRVQDKRGKVESELLFFFSLSKAFQTDSIYFYALKKYSWLGDKILETSLCGQIHSVPNLKMKGLGKNLFSLTQLYIIDSFHI